MKKIIGLLAAGVFLSVAALSSAAATAQGAFEGHIQMKMTGKDGAQNMDYYSKGGLLRVEPEGGKGGSGAVIMDAAKKKMLILMDAQRSYMEMPLKDDAVKGGKTRGGKAGTGKLVKTGKTEKILGYPCEQYLAKGDEGEMEMWITKKLGPFFGVANPMGGASSAWEKDVKAQGGFPMRVIGKDKKGQEEYRMDVTKVEKKVLPASLFQPPAGYEKMSMPVGMPFGK